MNEIENKRALVRLQAVLDTHGADPKRWSAAEAARLVALTQADAKAGRMLREARALDQILAAAPAGDGAGRLAGLTDRVIKRAAAGTAEIVALPGRAASSRSSAATHPRRLWPAFAAMAAALAIGFFVGTSSLVAPAFQQVAGLSLDEPDTGPAAADEAPEGELL